MPIRARGRSPSWKGHPDECAYTKADSSTQLRANGRNQMRVFFFFFYIKHDGDLCCVNRRRQLLLFCQQRQLNNVWLQTNKNAAKPNLMRCIGQRVSSAHRPHQFYILFVFAFLPEKLNVHYFQSAIFLSDFQIHCPEKGLICASRK